jgi:hypothetical protein
VISWFQSFLSNGSTCTATPRLIQNEFRFRMARKRSALQEKFGPRALPPYVDHVIPPVRLLKVGGCTS